MGQPPECAAEEDTVEQLTIGAFARRARLSPKALRLYDRLGLLTPRRVDEATGYRWYDPDQVDRARLVVLLRRLDMPLARIAEVVELPGPEAADAVAAHWSAAEERFAAQRAVAGLLQDRLSGRSQDMYEVTLTETAGHTVLTERRRVLAGELPRWIPRSCERLHALAESCGGAAGPPFVVYHGEVSEESDSPAEVCLPVAADVPSARAAVHRATAAPAEPDAGAMSARPEPPRRLAAARVTKSLMVYPRMLPVYDAVAQWALDQGLERVGPGREIYFADWAPAAPEDEVCAIAFPVR
ncbi:MerR family transcriptional regulator [Streptomyces clavuligerus]|nr:MerR family transcriptional regulator [Streptomyces clavuligerus]QPL66679.1 MerR family transcriptional regulator [Streptomyces clavuligerus]QPL72708.1 MerR family transcriptional regulator [Streptomyces clavuligerus]QPL78786.1 MerR family transcriptional regulator [Streptomyces clavuligerus]QPL84813.1 MerR family transcriptional regulator [Streptomyces clavuligerus]